MNALIRSTTTTESLLVLLSGLFLYLVLLFEIKEARSVNGQGPGVCKDENNKEIESRCCQSTHDVVDAAQLMASFMQANAKLLPPSQSGTRTRYDHLIPHFPLKNCRYDLRYYDISFP